MHRDLEGSVMHGAFHKRFIFFAVDLAAWGCQVHSKKTFCVPPKVGRIPDIVTSREGKM